MEEENANSLLSGLPARYNSMTCLYVRACGKKLYVEGRGLGLGDLGLVGLEGLLHFGGEELLNLLGSTADEGAGVKESIKLIQDGGEESSATDAVEQVVVQAELLDVVGGLVGEDTCCSTRNC